MEYQIGQFSKLTLLSVKTLRHYDEIGLLKPSRIDSESNYRYYSDDQIEKADIIEKLKRFEFPLNEITEIINSYSDDSDIQKHLKQRADNIKLSLKKYKQMNEDIETAIRLHEEDTMNIEENITIKTVVDLPIIHIRYKGKYSDIGKYFGKLFRVAGRHIAGKPFALYYDEGYEEIADIDACIPVKKEINREGIGYRVLSGGKAHSLIHLGPYETLTSSYKKMIDYLQAHNIKPRQLSREIYIKSPGMIFKGNPKKYITEIQMFENN